MDLFSDADVEGREDEVLDDGQDGDGDGGDVVGAPSVVGTVWNDLYD